MARADSRSTPVSGRIAALQRTWAMGQVRTLAVQKYLGHEGYRRNGAGGRVGSTFSTAHAFFRSVAIPAQPGLLNFDNVRMGNECVPGGGYSNVEELNSDRLCRRPSCYGSDAIGCRRVIHPIPARAVAEHWYPGGVRHQFC